MAGLRVLALIKQVPAISSLVLEDGRMRREGVPLEMSAFCRRALSKGVELARDSKGSCTVATLGSASAEDVLKEAIAWGADEAVLISDPLFAGSDTLGTAKILAALVRREGPFDLILVGRSSLDGGTGQVGPQLAELLDLPYASAVRKLELDSACSSLRVQSELDDGWRICELPIAAIVGVAERLCAPAKVSRDTWGKVPSSRIRTFRASDLVEAGSGVAESRTKVLVVEKREFFRDRQVFAGTIEEQVDAALDYLDRRTISNQKSSSNGIISTEHRPNSAGPVISALLDPTQGEISQALLGTASALTAQVGGWTAAISMNESDPSEMASWGADEIVQIEGALVEEDFAAGIVVWARQRRPLVLLGPATSFGVEVASRVAASLGVGLLGEAFDPKMDASRLIVRRLACSSSQIVTLGVDSPIQMATLRPDRASTAVSRLDSKEAVLSSVTVEPRGRVRLERQWRDDDWLSLERAEVVIGIGAGVKSEETKAIFRLAELLGAEVAGTRKVTDLGLLPRSRQIGITGRSIAPKFYLAIGLSGRENHIVGVRDAETIIAINSNERAPIFASCDLGIVGDWCRAVEVLVKRVARGRAVLVQVKKELSGGGSDV